MLAGLLLLGGCSHLNETVNPLSWWHELQGGAIAEQRPPPPNADAPYPNLATVPPKPTPPDPAVRQRVASGLLADRTNAQYAAAQSPIVVPPPTVVAPPKPAAANPDALSASLEAASAPPPPQPKPAPAPPPQASAPAMPGAAPPGPVAQAPAGPAPTIPDAPPPSPVLPGVLIPVTAPTPAPKPPPAPIVALTPSEAARAPVPVPFAPGSAILPPGAEGPLKRLAARRAGSAIDIVGFGEATDTTPQLQSAAITLGFARARAIAAVLMAAGVPVSALRLDAQAAGRAADARLVD